MARLDTIRDSILGVITDTPNETVHQVTVMGPVEEEEESNWTFDDEDFWEAIDLLETCISMLDAIRHLNDTMSPGRKKLLDNHIDDLKMFVGTFIVPKPEDE